MVGVDIDSSALVKRMTDLEKRKLPMITLRALNDAAFEVRKEWKDTIPSVFDRPTSLTLNAPLYRKATLQKLEAEVYIRDEATKGTPPAEYLIPQVFGGSRKRKRSEMALAQSLDFPAYFVPGNQADLDQFGNLKRGVIQKIQAQLRGSHDPTQHETDKRRKARLGRQRRLGGGGSYFVLPVKRGKLRAGVVYERTKSIGPQKGSKATSSSNVRAILFGLSKPPRYTKRFDAIGLARSIFARRFEAKFRDQLTRATGGRL